MKFVFFVITFFVLRVALAETTFTYNCTSMEGLAVLTVVENQSITFQPNVSSDYTYQGNFSDLHVSQIPFLPQYVAIEHTGVKRVNRLGIQKVVTDVLVSPEALRGELSAIVVVSTREMTMVTNKLKAVKMKSYNCGLR